MPTAPVPACSTGLCPEPGTIKGKCRDHAAAYDHQLKDVDRRKVYASRRWKALRKQTFKEQHGKCAIPGCYNLCTDLDHVTPMREGGAPLARSNVQGLCKKHHSQKTRREVFGSKADA